MEKIENISHEGKIVDISEEYISVEIINKSACSGCHAKSVCVASDQSVKIIDIPYTLGTLVDDYKVGDEVNVILKSSLAADAIWIAYVFPLVALFLAIFILSSIGLAEIAVGLGAIGTVAVYYAVLAFFRNKLSRIFTFSIEKKI